MDTASIQTHWSRTRSSDRPSSGRVDPDTVSGLFRSVVRGSVAFFKEPSGVKTGYDFLSVSVSDSIVVGALFMYSSSHTNTCIGHLGPGRLSRHQVHRRHWHTYIRPRAPWPNERRPGLRGPKPAGMSLRLDWGGQGNLDILKWLEGRHCEYQSWLSSKTKRSQPMSSPRVSQSWSHWLFLREVCLGEFSIEDMSRGSRRLLCRLGSHWNSHLARAVHQDSPRRDPAQAGPFRGRAPS